MSDHEHDYWRTASGGLECACGKSKAPALSPSPAEQAQIDRFGIFEQEAGHGRIGRGCCAQCWSPWMCGWRECGCHIPIGAICRARGCRAGLFVTIPSDSDAATLDAQLRLVDELDRSAA